MLTFQWAARSPEEMATIWFGWRVDEGAMELSGDRRCGLFWGAGAIRGVGRRGTLVRSNQLSNRHPFDQCQRESVSRVVLHHHPGQVSASGDVAARNRHGLRRRVYDFLNLHV